MPLYLSEEMIGTGVWGDPYRPRGVADRFDQWSVIYLGNTGKSFLWLPNVSLDPTLTLLGSDRVDTMGLVLRTRLGNKLNLPTSSFTNTREIIAEALLTSGKGWNTLQPTRGKYQVWLNELWEERPAIGGGASATEVFSAAIDTGKWAVGPGSHFGDIQSVSGKGRATSLSTDSSLVLLTPSIGADQYAQVVITGSSAEYAGVILRGQTSGNICYGIFAEVGGNCLTYKWDSGGAQTQIGADTGTVASGSLLYGEISGSSLLAKDDGANLYTPRTDTTIASGQPGCFMYAQGDVALVEIDTWEGGDLGGGGASSPLRRVFAFQAVTRSNFR